MNDYISRQAAIDAVKHAWAKGIEPSQYIESIEPADVAPVVRCKDCKFCCRNDAQDWYWCERGLVVIKVRPDDFCSYGERKE